MRLLIHLGPTNTGSAFVAQTLRANSERMAANGWCYPRAGSAPQGPSHEVLARTKPSDRAAVAATILAEAEGAIGIILSSSSFEAWEAGEFAELADALGAETVDLVYMLRDPFDRFSSAWHTGIRLGWAESLPDFFVDHFKDPAASTILNPRLTFERLRGADPRFRLRIVPYEAWASGKWDIVAPIWKELIEMPQGYTALSGRPRQSFSLELTEFLRATVKQFSHKKPGLGEAAMRRVFINADLSLWTFGQSDLAKSIDSLMRHHLRPRRVTTRLSRDCHAYGDLREVLAGEYNDDVVGRWAPGVMLPGGSTVLGYYERWHILNEPSLREVMDGMHEKLMLSLQAMERERAV